MRYLLDTCTCVELFHNNPSVVRRLNSLQPQDCFISDVTVAELMYGAEKSTRREMRLAQVERFIQTVGVIPFRSAVPIFAKEKTRLESIGQRIDDFDLLIACSSIVSGATLVTDNLKHMSRVQGIKIENWVER